MDQHGRAELSVLEEFCAWQGAELQGSEAHITSLDGSACSELLGTLAGLRARNLNPGRVRRADVPLAGLTRTLAEARDAVIYGRGFALLRRLPIERLSDDDAGLAFAALAAHIGQGHGLAGQAADLRGCDLTMPLGSDPADVTALLCVREPEEGFGLRLASAVAVHNAMVRERPQALAALYERDHAAPPPFARIGDRLFAHFERAAPLRETRASREAAEALTRAEASALRLDFEPGDVLLTNNHHVMFGLGNLAHGFGPLNTGRILRLRLDSRLVGTRPAPYAESAPWPDQSRSQVAA